MFKLVIFVSILSLSLATKEAIVKLKGLTDIKGYVKFEKNKNFVKMTGEITGLSPGKHGFHVHRSGDISNGCELLGEYFNPIMKNGLHVVYRTVGSFQADSNGVANITLKSHFIDLQGDLSIIGRGVSIYKNIAKLGKPKSQKLLHYPTKNCAKPLPTTNDDVILACGVVGVL